MMLTAIGVTISYIWNGVFKRELKVIFVFSAKISKHFKITIKGY